MWERFSFYGMRSLLFLYMLSHFHFSTRQAGLVYGVYSGLVYLTALLGGWVADVAIGPHRAIVSGGILMLLGHILLGLSNQYVWFYMALLLIAVGNGFFKPNITVLLGRLYPMEATAAREMAFAWFYTGINVGAFLSPLLCGTLGQKFSMHAGFLAAGMGMLVALVVFGWGIRHMVGFDHKSLEAAPVIDDQRNMDAATIGKKMLALMLLGFLGNAAFLAAFEQAGDSLTLFAQNSTQRVYYGFEIPSSWLQSVNPLAAMVCSPLMPGFWQWCRRCGIALAVVEQFMVGLLVLSLSFVWMSFAGHLAMTGQVSILFLLLTYLGNTFAELCIMPIGLNAVVTMAPPQHKGLAMGLWFGCLALGNLMAGAWAGYYALLGHTQFFGLIALFTLLCGLALWLLRPFLNKQLLAQS